MFRLLAARPFFVLTPNFRSANRLAVGQNLSRKYKKVKMLNCFPNIKTLTQRS
jgi:hypothetical protein